MARPANGPRKEVKRNLRAESSRLWRRDIACFQPATLPWHSTQGDALLDATRFACCVELACPGLVYLGPLARMIWNRFLCRTAVTQRNSIGTRGGSLSAKTSDFPAFPPPSPRSTKPKSSSSQRRPNITKKRNEHPDIHVRATRASSRRTRKH